MEPILLTEEIVSFFKFWMDGQIQEGMRWNCELFRHHRTFSKSQRELVFTSAWELTHDGTQVVITVSPDKYQIWLNLRTLSSEKKRSINQELAIVQELAISGNFST